MGKDSKKGKSAHKSRKHNNCEKEHGHKSSKKEKKKSSHDIKIGSSEGPELSDLSIVTEQICSDDFFRLSEEFRVWLHFTDSRSMEDMSSEAARELFDKFVSLWNSRRLSVMYYDGIPSEIRDACLKTKHKWGITLSEQDKMQLISTSEEVERKTRRRTEGTWNHMAPPLVQPAFRGMLCLPTNTPVNAVPTGAGSFSTAQYYKEFSLEQERALQKAERYMRRDFLDYVAPKETGHAAIVDKRKILSSKIHAASVEKEMSRDGFDLPEADIFGGEDDFASTKARLGKRSEARVVQKNQRLKDIQDRDKDRASFAMKQLGIDVTRGEKIIIPPRSDSGV